MSVPIDSVSVVISAAGAETTLAQLVAVRTQMQALSGQAVTLKADTTALTAARTEVGALGTAHQGLGKNATTLKMDVSQTEGARTSVKNLDNDLLSLASTAGKVGPALAAAFAGGALVKFASDYQTLLVQTSNQTNMTTADITTLDKTIRALPSGSAPLASLASGIKNVTDRGYSMADAQKIATEESKAATAAGADQATTMLAITSAMKEYNAGAQDVAKYSNIVTEAARLGNTTLNAWTEGTRTGVAVAAAYGVSLQEADAFMVALTRHGFDASESATQLRGVIQHIVNESPNTVKEIANIKASTGIDLTPDFGPDAIKVRGFTQIMQDLQDVVAKTGDDSIVTKLIPALRGGQGALITVTQAAADSKDALLLLGQAGSGALTPVEGGFARIQQTAGYQFGQTMKQLKFDLIDVGQAGLPAVTALAEGFGKIPAPVIESGVRLGELALAVKSASVVGGLLTSTWEKMTAATTTATAASATEATTTTAVADGTATLTAALTANTEAVLANTAAKADQAVAAEATVVTAETGTVAIEGETVATLAHATATETDTAATLANNSARAAKNLLAAAGPAIAIGEGINAYSGVFSDLKNGDFKQAFGDFIKNEPASPQGLISLASNLFGFKNPLNALPFWQQSKTAAPGSSGDTSTSGAPTDAGKDPFGLIANTQPSDAEIQAMTDHYDLLATKRDELLAKGAPEALVNHALYPEDFGESKAQLAQYTKDLALWQTQYAATQKAASAAQTELGKVDVSKGIASLASSAAGLEKVRAGLAAVGQSNDALNNLTSIASKFDDIAKSTDAASASYDAYTALLTNTNSYETKLTNYKKELDSAVTAATDAVTAGTATPDQVALLRDAPNIYGNIAQSMAQLDAHKAGDVLSIAKDMPDWVQADTLTRSTADNLGGIKAVDISVTTDKDAATTALEDLVSNPHIVTLHVQTVNDGGASTSTSTNAAAPPTSGSGPVNPAGWNQFEPLTQGQYSAIVTQGAGGKPSPLDDQYASVVAAAQKYGVDPRVLLTLTQMETNNGTNPNAYTQGNNFAGIKYGNQPGATAGGTSPEGDAYANFNTPGDFFNAEAANLTTGDYAGYYQRGDLLGARQHYVAGNATPSGDQATNIQNTARTYANYATQYPASDAANGGGAAIDISRFRQAVDTSGGDTSTGDKIAQTAASHLNEAKQATGQAWDQWCETFVDNVVQEATGINFRGPNAANPEAHVAAARAGVSGAGRLLGPNETVQPGDIAEILPENMPQGSTYDPSSIGHTGIVAEDTSKFYNTGKGGIQLTDIPAGTIFIRPDGVVSGTPSEGATAVKTANVSNALANSVGTKNYTDPLAKQSGDASAHVGPVLIGSQTNVLAGILQDLGGKGAAQLNNYFDQIFAAETKQFTENVVGKNKGGSLTADQKKTIDNQALTQSLDLTNAVGRAMLDVDQHSANYATDLQKVRDLGGPIGDNLAQQVDLYRQIGETTAKIAADQTAVTNLETANTQRKQQESADDQAAARAKTRDSWATAENDAQIARYQQGIQAGWQQEQVIQTAKQTVVDRNYQDAVTAEDRSHTVKMRNLDDQLKSMQKLQQTANSGNSVTEQNLSVAATGPGDLATKFQAGELLAIQKDFDSRNRQSLTDQIAAITDAQIAENRLYEDDKYHRDQAHTTATRNFQDEATQAQNNHTAVTNQWASEAFQRAETARRQTITDTEAQWQLQDIRAKKDAQYTTDKAAADATLKSDQDHAKALTEQATATSDALKTWSKIADLVGSAGNGLLSVLPAMAALAGSGGGLTQSDKDQIIAIVDARTNTFTRRLGGADGIARGA